MHRNNGNETQIPETMRPRVKFWLQRTGVAFLITVAIQLIFLYLKYGELRRYASFTFLMEFTFTFLYFLSLFWLYPRISRLVHSPTFSRLRSVYINIIEGVAVAVSTTILTLIMKMMPLAVLAWIFNARVDDRTLVFDTDAMRQNLIVHAVLGLFLYYFVERERIRKQIQAEHLRYAELQREEFRGQLENLKNQMNPQFLFHSLESLDSLLDKDQEEAADFVKRLSSVYRSFLRPEEQLVSLARELELTEGYIYIMKVRFEEQIEFDIKTSPQFMSLQLPPGSLQVLIDHACFQSDISDEQAVHIDIRTENEKLIVRFPFQGKQEKPLEDNLKNIVERYKYFTNENLEVVKNSREITVKLPLLRLEEESRVQ